MSPSPQFPADLVTFTEEILNRKLHVVAIANTFQAITSVMPELIHK